MKSEKPPIERLWEGYVIGCVVYATFDFVTRLGQWLLSLHGVNWG